MNRLCALVLLVAGCGSARYIQKTDMGGTLLLEGNRSTAMSQAERMMVIHCAGTYRIVANEESVGTTEAERLQATKVRYVCRSAPPKPAAPAATVQSDAGEPPLD